jgi:hypothetical protein
MESWLGEYWYWIPPIVGLPILLAARAQRRRGNESLVWRMLYWASVPMLGRLEPGRVTPRAAILWLIILILWTVWILGFLAYAIYDARVAPLTSNKSLERTVNHHGGAVRALAVSARAGANEQRWPAVQHNR